jgi:hypothetical protein
MILINVPQDGCELNNLRASPLTLSTYPVSQKVEFQSTLPRSVLLPISLKFKRIDRSDKHDHNSHMKGNLGERYENCSHIKIKDPSE